MPHPPASITIGDRQISPPVILAPLEGLTDRVFRGMIRDIGGVGLTVTEFVASEGLVRHVPAIVDTATPGTHEEPLAVQIYGHRPQAMAEATRMVEDLGAHLVDINMGCPVRKVVRRGAGAGLLRDPGAVARVVAAVRGATALPVTVKMRTGWTPATRNAVEVARICEEEGAEALTVHWRTREEMYRSAEPRLEDIRAVREAVRIPVVGNGDVVDVPTARRMWEETGCHGVMVGRGAVRDPWLPLKIRNWLHGRPPPVVRFRHRRDLLLAYVQSRVERCQTERGALGQVKRFCGFFTRGLPHGAAFRRDIYHTQTLPEALDLVESWFAERMEREEALVSASSGRQDG